MKFSLDTKDIGDDERYHRYAYGHLSDAVRKLCVEPGMVNQRLWHAFEAINKIDVDSLPDNVRKDLKWSISEATKFEKNGSPDLETTLRRIRSSTGSKIASRILKAKTELESYIS